MGWWWWCRAWVDGAGGVGILLRSRRGIGEVRFVGVLERLEEQCLLELRGAGNCFADVFAYSLGEEEVL